MTSTERPSCQLCGDTVSIDASGDILWIVQSAALPDGVSDADLIAAVGEIIAASEHRRAILDVRGDPKRPLRVLSSELWGWLISEEAALQRLALVLSDDLTRIQANMTAVAQNASVRAFTDEAEAREWVRQSDRERRRARTLPNTLRARSRSTGSPGFRPPGVDVDADHPFGDEKR